MKIYPDTSPKWLWLLKEKEASENISNICARIRHKEFTRRLNNEKTN